MPGLALPMPISMPWSAVADADADAWSPRLVIACPPMSMPGPPMRWSMPGLPMHLSLLFDPVEAG